MHLQSHTRTNARLYCRIGERERERSERHHGRLWQRIYSISMAAVWLNRVVGGAQAHTHKRRVRRVRL